MEELKLPKDFLLGTAGAAVQIEGGDRNNTWYRWCEQGHIRDGSHCISANDHWNRYREDILFMKELHQDTCRMGIEWSRIQPEPGRFDPDALSHYRDVVHELTKNNIKPLITLHHFSHPLWLEDLGGWENPAVVGYFKNYTQYVVENLGDQVSDWITINEPNVFTTYGYLYGTWPPGKKDIGAVFRVYRNMIKAHIEAYKLIHEIRGRMHFPGKTMVGVAHHLRVFDPERNRLADKIPAKLIQYLFQDLVVQAMATGKFKFPLGFGEYPLGKGVFQDFFGVNYYSRDMVRFTFNPGAVFGELKVKANSPVNDLGWEIYPEGLYRLCKYYYRKFLIPVFITENGICDSNDTLRSKYIYDHLQQVTRLINAGIPVRRYYYWTLIDNFEWLEGESARFGLVHNDYRTQQRTIRPSGRFYGEICTLKEIHKAMIAKYLS